MLVVNPENPKTANINTVADLIAAAKAAPGALAYGSGGNGNATHLGAAYEAAADSKEKRVAPPRLATVPPLDFAPLQQSLTRLQAAATRFEAARPADGIDRRKGAAPREGELGRVGAGPHVLGDLDLAVGCH